MVAPRHRAALALPQAFPLEVAFLPPGPPCCTWSPSPWTSLAGPLALSHRVADTASDALLASSPAPFRASPCAPALASLLERARRPRHLSPKPFGGFLVPSGSIPKSSSLPRGGRREDVGAGHGTAACSPRVAGHSWVLKGEAEVPQQEGRRKASGWTEPRASGRQSPDPARHRRRVLPGPALPASTCEEGLAAFACRGPGFSFGRGAERGMGVRWAKRHFVVRRAEGDNEARRERKGWLPSLSCVPGSAGASPGQFL